MECRRIGRLSVFPVFYHINPSGVEKLKKDFKNYFDTLEDDPKDAKEAKWDYWRSLLDKLADWPLDPKFDEDPVESGGLALEKLSDISAWVVPQNSYVTSIIDKICGAIFVKTISDFPNIFDSLIGIESQVSNIMQLLNLEKENEVCLIGICGMGGLGKSTLAEVIYEKVSPQFDAHHFSKPIGKRKKKDYLVSVEKELISKIFPEGAAALSNNAYKVKDVLQKKLREKKVLIVLDDLWNNTQVEELVGDLKWFGPGSRIIITSRKHDLLHLCKDNVYEVQKLNEDDALKLFCWRAFEQPQPKEGFEELAKEVVGLADGLPFALKTFGSYLSNKEDKKRWNGYLKDLQDVPQGDILSMFQKSVEELDGIIIYPGQVFPLKELFLDIACFFNGHPKDYVLHILKGVEGFGNNLEHYLGVLQENSLLRISNDGKLWMHDLLVDLGRRMAKRNRLLQMEDIIRELKISLETPIENYEIKGIVLQLPLPEQETFRLEALSTMVNLRVLRIGSNGNVDLEVEMMKWINNPDLEAGRVKWDGDLSRLKLSRELRIIEWWKYPLKFLPIGSNNVPWKLVELKLLYSHIRQLWVGLKSFPNLRHIDLRSAEKLIKIPDLSLVPNLEILDLSFCGCLSALHSSVGDLKRLRELHLSHCFALKEFPDEIRSESLETLNLSGCRNLKKFPKIPCSLPVLRDLNVSKTPFREQPFSSQIFPSLETFQALRANMEELPPSIAFSLKLRQLRFASPTSTTDFRLPAWLSTLSSLERLSLFKCYFSDEAKLIELRGLSSLKDLNLGGNKFTKVPDIVSELSILNMLDMTHCTFLKALSKLPLSLNFLLLANCPLLKAFDSQMTEQNSRKMLRKSGCSFIVAYIGFEDKPYKILYLHPESPPYKDWQKYLVQLAVACGPMQASRILSSFIRGSRSSNKKFQIPIEWNLDNGMFQPWVCALLIVYEVYGNDKRESRKRKFDELENPYIGSEGNKSIFPEFVCQLQLNEVSSKYTFVVCVPEATCVGSHGLWVCINIANSFQKSELVKRWRCGVSVRASGKNVVLKEGGARLLNRDAHLELVEVVRTVSRSGLDSRSLDLSLNQHLIVRGPIKWPRHTQV